MSEDSNEGVDIGPCPICGQKVFVVMTDPNTGLIQKPDPGTPTWSFLVQIGRYHQRMRIYGWTAKLWLWDRMQLIKVVTSDDACAEYDAQAEDSLADTLMEAAVQARSRADDKRARVLALREDIQQEQDDAKA
jgi:hypothetical protein